jgi:tetratricopeptide (TPR) repeat protein
VRAPAFGLVAVLALAACDMVQVYQGQIDQATRALAGAKSDAARAAAYSDRGRGYSDKARLSYARKAIDRDEYLRLFALATADHDRAVGLAPADAKIHFDRGLSYYDRAAMTEGIDADHAPWFESARADFAAAATLDPGRADAHDYLGLVDEQTGRFDEAIADYTKVMALDPRLGRQRLTEAYCDRGQDHLRDKKYDLAAADFEKSVELGGSIDPCACQPYEPLAYIYIDATGQYDKGWDLVKKAAVTGHPISAEYVLKLEKASGRRG